MTPLLVRQMLSPAELRPHIQTVKYLLFSSSLCYYTINCRKLSTTFFNFFKKFKLYFLLFYWKKKLETCLQNLRKVGRADCRKPFQTSSETEIFILGPYLQKSGKQFVSKVLSKNELVLY